ncbi:hypothetical protein QNH36_08140 [Mesobacillus sp. AQ2]|jgi:hypothetical protein|uniref:hypothetical protein n=1 Tax=Bacillaceae TaxID=186817 RepID=UPI0011AA5A97|nr:MULTISPECIES: hypothetical protein [Bacillaceae]MCM3123501.1 hypothetical protein [Mesobacillus sp. MER 33]MCM3233016.1 hypothetical protein [Mesobacillus sp. MER 48]WHX42091.1 hypothetical protein QNH36_08140 [Mesobacillus sp. AQ2]
MKYYDMRMEIMFIPMKNGYLKVFVSGFDRLGTWGNSIAVFNGVSATAKGFNKKRTIVHSIAKLHKSLERKSGGK